MFLNLLIIRALAGFAELTSSVHPTPEMLSRSDNIVRNVVENIIELVVAGSGCKVRVLVSSLNLEEWIALGRISYRLVD